MTKQELRDRVRLLVDDILCLDFNLAGEKRGTGYGVKTREGVIETIIEFLDLETNTN